jgi:hypothetical protein
VPTDLNGDGRTDADDERLAQVRLMEGSVAVLREGLAAGRVD